MIGLMLVAEVALELGVGDMTEHVEMPRLAVDVEPGLWMLRFRSLTSIAPLFLQVEPCLTKLGRVVSASSHESEALLQPHRERRAGGNPRRRHDMMCGLGDNLSQTPK